MNKLPQITTSFWIMKICATTLGETGGDFIVNDNEYWLCRNSFEFFSCYSISPLFTKKYHPIIYWAVILATSTAGITISDFMDRSLGLGYAAGTVILVTCLIATLVLWKATEKSLSVTNIKSCVVKYFIGQPFFIFQHFGNSIRRFFGGRFSTEFFWRGNTHRKFIVAYCFGF